MKEYGRIGQNRWAGTFYEEFLPELTGLRGIKAYREMADNDDKIGAMLFAIKMLIRKVPWSVEPGGTTPRDEEAAEFVEGCLYDMSSTWTDTISEILSFLTYGWSYHEIVYKRRMGKKRGREQSSKFDDGMIGWAKLPIRSQDTLYQWEYDENDNLLGMTQQPPPNFDLRTIPITKALLFRTESFKDVPEGRSILRNAYRSWYFKRRLQEIEAIGIERDMAGLPVMYVPSEEDIYNSEDPQTVSLYNSMVRMVKNIRRNESEGIVLPDTFKLELLSSGGSRQFDTNAVIQRYDTAIVQTVMADFIMLGHEGVGSYALSSDKTSLFTTAISAYLDIICETFNSQGIPRLIDLNGGRFSGITDYPQLTHGDAGDRDIEKLSTFVKDLVNSGVILPDEQLEDYLRAEAHLPERTEDLDMRTPDPLREEARRRPEGPQEAAEGEEEPGAVNPSSKQEEAEEEAGGAPDEGKKPKRRRDEDDEEDV